MSECLGIAAKPFNATLCTPEGVYRLDEGDITMVRCPLIPQSSTQIPQLDTLNPKPETLYPKSQTLNPKRSTPKTIKPQPLPSGWCWTVSAIPCDPDPLRRYAGAHSRWRERQPPHWAAGHGVSVWGVLDRRFYT